MSVGLFGLHTVGCWVETVGEVVLETVGEVVLGCPLKSFELADELVRLVGLSPV